MKPRIAIPTPTSTDLVYNDRSWKQYAAAVEQAGGEAVRLELGLSTTELRDLAATCAGVCLPGSPADVDPVGYGETPDPATAAADPAREACDFLLLEDAAAQGKPVLGICFGMQAMNVWRGGSLVQDLLPMPVNHAAGGKVAIAHSALVLQDSVLGRLIGSSDATRAEAPAEAQFLRLPINTSHHQAVSVAGEGLRVTARCPEDGVVEAVEWPAAPGFFVGVQWHPERSTEISAVSRALFATLVAEAGALASRHNAEAAVAAGA
jgi:putative glutamine amidotransferase